MYKIIKVFVVLIRVFLAYLEAVYKLIFPNKRKSIRGKIVLVTGAGRGIGKSLAKLFSDCGANVVIWDINEAELQGTASEIKARGGTAYAYRCDVTRHEDVENVAARVRADVGDVYMVVNNAGVLLAKDTLSLTPEEIQKVFNVNIISHFYINNQFLPAMLKKNEGHIVTISSMSAKIGTNLLTDYSASKFAAFGYTEALTEELRLHYRKPGIKTTTVCPMFTSTTLILQHNRRIEIVPGPEGVLPPETVAETIVDGVLRNKREVYVPSHYNVVDFSRAMLPLKVRQCLNDAVGTGFFDRSKTQ